MGRIAILTNPDPIVDAKANFFADYFHLFLSQLGRSIDFELENPLALIDKILFQLQHNLDNCESIARSYLTHPMLFDNDVFLSQFDCYKPAKRHFEEWIRLSPKEQKKHFSENTASWIQVLQPLREELSQKMFGKSLQSIISFLGCPHELCEHKEDIEGNTRILLTEFIFRGLGKEYISDVFNQILSRDIEIYPFPQEVTTEQDKKDYMASRTLQQQFLAIEAILNMPSSKVDFYYKIYGASLPKEIAFDYTGVVFYSSRHENCSPLKKEHPEFFKGDSNFFIASVNVDFLYSEGAIKDAIKQIAAALKYVSVALNRNFVIDRKHNYILRNAFGTSEGWGFDSFKYKYEPKVIDKLDKSPFHFLAGVTNSAKNYFLNFEPLYINASSEENMPAYWHYLEALMQSYKKEKKLMEKVASICILRDAAVRKEVGIEFLSSSLNFMHLPRTRFGITAQEGHAMAMEIIRGIIPESVRAIDYPAIKDMVFYMDYALTAEDFRKAKDYYMRILQDAYAQRNFYLHQGSSSNKSHIKLLYSLRFLVHRFRFIVMGELKNNEEVDFSKLVENLYLRSMELLKLAS